MARRLEEDIANTGVPLCGDQVPLLEEEVIDDQGPVNPPPLMDGDIRDSSLHMAQVITIQAQATITQTKAMMA